MTRSTLILALISAALLASHAAAQAGDDPAIDRLIRDLGDPDKTTREAAIKALGEAGPKAKDALPALGARLKAAPIGEAYKVIEALGKVGPSAVDTLIQGLANRDTGLQRYTAFILERLGPKAEAAVPPLLAALKKPTTDDQVKVEIIYALGGIGARAAEAVPTIIETELAWIKKAKNGQSTPERDSSRPLAAIGPAALEPLRPLLTTKGSGRGLAIDALTIIGPDAKTCLPDLIKALASERVLDLRSSVLREASLLATTIGWEAIEEQAIYSRGLLFPSQLGRCFKAIGAPSHAPLAAAIADPSPQVRGRALNALGLIGTAAKQHASAMVPALKDKDKTVRAQAVLGLARIDGASPTVIKALDAALEDPEVIVRIAAGRAIYELGAPAHETRSALTAALLKDTDDVFRILAAIALGKIGPKAAPSTDQLQALLTDRNSEVVLASIEALRLIGPGAAASAPALRKLLEVDPKAGQQMIEPEVIAAAAARALSAVDAEALPEVLPKLQAALIFYKPMVRSIAIQAYASIGLRGLPSLLEAFTLPRPYFWSIRKALETIRPDATPKILAAALGPDPKVAAFSARVLGLSPPADPAIRQEIFTKMTPLVNSKDKARREAALFALGAAAPASVPVLIKALEDPTLRSIAVQALGSVGTGHPEAARALLPFLQNPGPDTKSAFSSLERLGCAEPEVIEAIAQSLQGPRYFAAVLTLTKLGPKARAAIPALLQAQIPESYLIKDALRAIQERD